MSKYTVEHVIATYDSSGMPADPDQVCDFMETLISAHQDRCIDVERLGKQAEFWRDKAHELRRLAAQPVAVEPALYQVRAKPDWRDGWGPWGECSKDAYDDFIKTPHLHNWEYEARALYTAPPAQAVPDGCVLVPIVSTSEMDIAGAESEAGIEITRHDAELIWNAMLAAAPSPADER